jgi:UDP-glucose 4-epimerase
VNTFTFRAAMAEPLTVYGDGENWRPFVHVHDSARAYREALEWPAGVYNVGHENYRIEEIAEAVAEVVGRDVPITYLGDEDPGPSYHVSFDKLSTVPYEPRKSLRAGVESLANRFP